jgi:glycosyltransferase involved in cell wall biosynthesis
MSRIAIVGRLVPDKGQDVVCALSRQLPDAEFFLVGPFENADQSFVRLIRQRAAGNVKLVGYQHPVIGYLRSTDIGILLVPSRIAEACPLTPIEGAVAGCVVIARNLGGLAEVAGNLGALTVDDDAGFLAAIREVQGMDRSALSARLRSASQRAMTHYHPRRFERDVLAEFRWR